MPDQPLKGWELLRSDIPPQYRKKIDKKVYGVDGLEDVDEWYLIDRLNASGLEWCWIVEDMRFIQAELRKNSYGGEFTWYLITARGTLYIEREPGSGRYSEVDGRPTTGWRRFSGAGGHDNRKIDAAAKGAAITSAFKSANKWVQTLGMYRNGQMADFVVVPDDSSASQPAAGGTPPPSGPQAQGNPTLTDREKEAVKALLTAIPDKAAQNAAKQEAWAVMQRESVMAGVDWLIGWHRRTSGEDTPVVKMVLAMSGLWVGQEQRAA